MLYLITIVLNSLLPTPFLNLEHEFHLSKALVEYNEVEKALQVSMHLYIDDLEDALKLQGAENLNICTEKEFKDTDIIIEKYLNKHFVLEVDGKVVKYEFLGKEPAEDLAGLWCYLEAVDIEKVNQLAVLNNVLLEVFNDQKNIVSVIGPNRKKGVLLFEGEKIKETISY